MIWIVRRNLQLYFSKVSNVILSLLGALISIVLYLVFLKNNLTSSWGQLPHATVILDWWLIGGTMTITAITTTLNSLSIFVADRENKTFRDLSMTDVSPIALRVGYLISAVIIGTLMQLVMFTLLSIYFSLTDKIAFQWHVLLPLIGSVILSSFVWTAFNLLVTSFIHKVDSLGKVGTIIATAAGFFAGVYMPFGILSKTANHVIQLTPAPYNSALFRQILLKQPLKDTNLSESMLSTLKHQLGIGIAWHSNLTSISQNIEFMLFFIVILVIGVMIIGRKQQI